ncbi:hypothetical protein CPB84DRAFT_1791232 [Gymnopilus junonius]|uniref:F-box domain-containing protein n=1 Tax=Gymnopilus junonius TaxID=109634 RepID=A0A9P5THL6_GYMJU|nr:hypothetical protein CPB84DRAFT_1791232 [Gymnopilus junonius]
MDNLRVPIAQGNGPQPLLKLEMAFLNKSPILCLPFEILVEISVCYTEGIYNATHHDRFGTPNPTPGPFLLTAICQTWRCVALATPRVWRNINIHITSTDKVQLLSEQTKQCILLSGKLLLNIIFSIRRDILPINPISIPPLLDVTRDVAPFAGSYYEDLMDAVEATPHLCLIPCLRYIHRPVFFFLT